MNRSARILALCASLLGSLSAQQSAAFSGETGGTFVHPRGEADMNVEGVHSSLFFWGKETLARAGRNSLAFKGEPFTAKPGEEFGIGKIKYFNGTTETGTNATAVHLKLDLAFEDGTETSVNIPIKLISTKNDGTWHENADIIKLAHSHGDNIVTINGKPYQVELSFGKTTADGFSVHDKFHVFEEYSAIADLRGRLSPYTPPAKATVHAGTAPHTPSPVRTAAPSSYPATVQPQPGGLPRSSRSLPSLTPPPPSRGYAGSVPTNPAAYPAAPTAAPRSSQPPAGYPTPANTTGYPAYPSPANATPAPTATYPLNNYQPATPTSTAPGTYAGTGRGKLMGATAPSAATYPPPRPTAPVGAEAEALNHTSQPVAPPRITRPISSGTSLSAPNNYRSPVVNNKPLTGSSTPRYTAPTLTPPPSSLSAASNPAPIRTEVMPSATRRTSNAATDPLPLPPTRNELKTGTGSTTTMLPANNRRSVPTASIPRTPATTHTNLPPKPTTRARSSLPAAPTTATATRPNTVSVAPPAPTSSPLTTTNVSVSGVSTSYAPYVNSAAPGSNFNSRRGQVGNSQITYLDRNSFRVYRSDGLSFMAEPGFVYQLQSSLDGYQWDNNGEPVIGRGEVVHYYQEIDSSDIRQYRIRVTQAAR